MTVTIHRSEEAGWTRIQNEVLRDEHLTLRARGLLVQMLSHEDGWQMSLKYSESQCADGKFAVRAAFAELEKAGYAVRFQHREPNGRIRYDYDVWDLPHARWAAEADRSTEVGTTDVGTTEHGNTVPLEEALEEEALEEEQPQVQELPLAHARSREDAFIEFWSIYPRRAGKAAAVKAYQRAWARVKPDYGVLNQGAARFRDDPNREDEFTPHPATWLNQGRWEDDPLPARGNGKPTDAAGRMRQRLERLKQEGVR